LGSLFPKSLDALSVTRSFSIKRSFAKNYNDNLLKLKSEFKDFWKAALDHDKLDPVLFISTSESPSSDLSSDAIAALVSEELEVQENDALDDVWDF
jgi:hypothetical protein